MDADTIEKTIHSLQDHDEKVTLELDPLFAGSLYIVAEQMGESLTSAATSGKIDNAAALMLTIIKSQIMNKTKDMLETAMNCSLAVCEAADVTGDVK